MTSITRKQTWASVKHLLSDVQPTIYGPAAHRQLNQYGDLFVARAVDVRG